MNKTGFKIDSGFAQLFITFDFYKSFKIINSNNCYYMTSLKYINSFDKTISSIVLISRINITYKRFINNNLDTENFMALQILIISITIQPSNDFKFIFII